MPSPTSRTMLGVLGKWGNCAQLVLAVLLPQLLMSGLSILLATPVIFHFILSPHVFSRGAWQRFGLKALPREEGTLRIHTFAIDAIHGRCSAHIFRLDLSPGSPGSRNVTKVKPSSHVEPCQFVTSTSHNSSGGFPKVSQEAEPRLRSNRSSSELWPGCQASTLPTNSVRAQSQAVKHFGKWKKKQLTSLGYIATHKLLARVQRFGESLE